MYKRQEKEALKEEYTIPDKKGNKNDEQHKKGPKFTLDQISAIDSDIAEALENEEITMQEAMDDLKVLFDSMTQEERETFFDELGFEKPKNKEDKPQRENFQRKELQNFN